MTRSIYEIDHGQWTAPIVPRLAGKGGTVPAALIGKRIVAMGTVADVDAERAGLAIDVESADGGTERYVFGFTEMDMWFIPPRPQTPRDAVPGKRA